MFTKEKKIWNLEFMKKFKYKVKTTTNKNIRTNFRRILSPALWIWNLGRKRNKTFEWIISKHF